ncbi:MAG TPA: phosphoribosyltransferase [Polyangiaceae bacterium]|nr:phosphoribosyltransferase [Polyangiaceae bacterium]
MSLFRDRRHAGRVLAAALGKYRGTDVIVLGLPRGGVPVAYEVARALGAPLDVFVVRKLGVPGHEELAMGALASGGLVVLNEYIVRSLGITKEDIFEVTRTENHELARRERAYRGGRAPVNSWGKTVVLIDDGLATGATMRAAIRTLRQRTPARVVAAVPVAARETCSEMADEADDMICAATPEPFQAVGPWYEDFSQTTELEIRELLEAARREQEQREQATGARAGGP